MKIKKKCEKLWERRKNLGLRELKAAKLDATCLLKAKKEGKKRNRGNWVDSSFLPQRWGKLQKWISLSSPGKVWDGMQIVKNKPWNRNSCGTTDRIPKQFRRGLIGKVCLCSGNRLKSKSLDMCPPHLSDSL